MSRSHLLLLFFAGFAATLIWQFRPAFYPQWSAAETVAILDLRLSGTGPPPADPANSVAENPSAARLGHALFFDRRLSANGAIACAHCHQPIRRFTDGLPTAVALGLSRRNTPSLIGATYSPWQYWDGRRDSQWSQALAPLEDPAEHGFDRTSVVKVIAADAAYRLAYEALFGELPAVTHTDRFPSAASPLGTPAAQQAWQEMTNADREAIDRAFANVGKAIAAYERLLLPGATRMDQYLDAIANGDDDTARATFTADEAQGLRLFVGKARCVECHNGPLLTNHEFHNTGVLSATGKLPDLGRSQGLREVTQDPFNCLGGFNDQAAPYCGELRFARTGIELIGAMKTPSLRNLGQTAPYMHRGQLDTLRDVLEHYNEAPLAMIGHNEAKPLGLSRRELDQLEQFLLTLDAPLATAPEWLAPPDTERGLQLSAGQQTE